MEARTEFSRIVPRLRRYARLVSGKQQVGDELVVATLEALEHVNPSALGRPSVSHLFQLLSRIWNSEGYVLGPNGARTPDQSSGASRTRRALARQAALLTTVEGLSVAATAEILDMTPTTVRRLKDQVDDHDKNMPTADVLIIEDELFVATDLEDIVTDMGHRVIGLAATRRDAVAMARRDQPTLILADIALADGSSGLDTAHDILGMLPVPIIFITAYPERLLTGLRPEPTFLIEKPFRSAVVRATIGQALAHARPDNDQPKAATGAKVPA
ncbi:MAG: response regulator [Pseudomonadota bacterium]